MAWYGVHMPTTTQENYTQHDFDPAYTARGTACRTPWGHRGGCTCGARQQGLAGTERDALAWYYRHMDQALSAQPTTTPEV